MNLKQAINRLMSGGAALERPKSWPNEAKRGWGASRTTHPYHCDMAQACWESISNGEEFVDNDTVSEAFASGKPGEITAVRLAIATRYAELWIAAMLEQEREPQGESEAEKMRSDDIAQRTHEVNQDMRNDQ